VTAVLRGGAAWLLLACGPAPAPIDDTTPTAAAVPVAPTVEPSPRVIEPMRVVEAPRAAVAGAPPPELVDLRVAVPGLRLAIGYASADNFTGAPLPGYDAPGAWGHPALASALRAVDAALAPEGLGLLVFDAYRPKRATAAMVAWARARRRTDLLRDGYIAERSQHNRGLAIDLTLVERDTGTPLDMGGAWDAFLPSSAAFAATGAALAHRKRLRAAMLEQRFVPHDGEWWHFSLPHAHAPVLDVVYAAAP
jgi:D-alanyl-D-alanine dipeptidase